jgi:glycosyltransferase involved in cell wall biosynthesis
MRIGVSAPTFEQCQPNSFYGAAVGSAAFVKCVLGSDAVAEADLFAVSPDHARELDALAPALSDQTSTKCYVRLDQDLFSAVRDREYTVFVHPDLGPRVSTLVALRRHLGSTFRIIGLAHSLSNAEIIHAGMALLAADMDETDVIVCPSTFARTALKKLLESIGDRFPALPPTSAKLKAIPFAVDIARFHPSDAALARRRLGMDPDVRLLLAVGRIDPHYKQDFDPLVAAVEPFLRRADGTWRLVLAGRADGQQLGQLQAYLRAFDLERLVEILPNPREEVKPVLYQAADIFLAPYDGMQESFGIAVTEAMATGVPIVAASWNGLRESVEDGVTGLLAPTYLPGESETMPWPDIPYDDMHSQYLHAQATVVDVASFRAAVERLASSAALRCSMGSAARRSTERRFAPTAVSHMLNETLIERSDGPCVEVGSHSVFPAPQNTAPGSRWHIFSHYADRHVTGASVVFATRRSPDPRTLMANLGSTDCLARVVDIDRADAFLTHAAVPTPITEITERLLRQNTSPASARAASSSDVYLACWLLKHDYLELEPRPAGTARRASNMEDSSNPIQKPTASLSNGDHEVSPDIYIAGLGINSYSHVTPEVLGAMKSCNLVLLAHTEPKIAAHFAARNLNVRGLGRHWYSAPSVQGAHEAIADEVLLEARLRPPVMMAVYGHPRVLVRPTSLIIARASGAGLSVKVLPGISAIDTILVDLGIDPGEHGLQIVEMRRLLARPRQLAIDMPSIILQIGQPVVDAPFAERGVSAIDLAALRGALLETVPSDRRVAAVNSATRAFETSRITWIELSELPELSTVIDLGSSLFVPGLQVSQHT